MLFLAKCLLYNYVHSYDGCIGTLCCSCNGNQVNLIIKKFQKSLMTNELNLIIGIFNDHCMTVMLITVFKMHIHLMNHYINYIN